MEVRRAYRKVRSINPSATHVVGVFNFKNKEGYQDDNEHSAGYKLLKAVQKEKLMNVAVFVSRMYGGRNLGIKRHQIIKDVALQAINRICKS